MSSATWAMPKSITTGSPSSIRTLPGLRSRCTTSTAWMAASASPSPSPSRASPSPASGPRSETRWSSGGAGTYRVTTYGVSQSTSASSTSATRGLRTRVRVSTSRASRSRASGSPATCGRSTLTATARPCASRARWTTPMPPCPITWARRYRPSRRPVETVSLTRSRYVSGRRGQRHRGSRLGHVVPQVPRAEQRRPSSLGPPPPREARWPRERGGRHVHEACERSGVPPGPARTAERVSSGCRPRAGRARW